MISDEKGARDWLGAQTDDAGMERLARLADLLIDESDRQNLVSQGSLAQIWRRHFADSAQLAIGVPTVATRWLDIGSGAGFPGLVVACVRPSIDMILTEPRTRRAEWLMLAVGKLGLSNTMVIGRPVERLEPMKVDVISARAVAPLDRLLSMSLRFSTAATQWRLPKGQSAQQELDELRGWDHVFHVEQSLTDPNAGIITGTLRGGERIKP